MGQAVSAAGQADPAASGRVVSLDRVRSRGRVEVVAVSGGRQARRMLGQLNIRVGEVLRLQRRAPLGGPVLVETGGSVVAVGRGLGRKVLVRRLP